MNKQSHAHVQYILVMYELCRIAAPSPHQRDAADFARLKRALQAPSLYDEVLRLLSRRGYGIPAEVLDSGAFDLSLSRTPCG